MMSNPNPIPLGGDLSPSPTSGKTVWLVTADEQLNSRIRGLLGTLGCEIIAICPLMTQAENPWEWTETKPEIVVLDIDRDVDWGQGIIDGIQRGRRDTPVVVLTQAFSREFGAKIVSRGTRYYFPHDFCPDEFLEVIRNLARGKDGSSKESVGKIQG